MLGRERKPLEFFRYDFIYEQRGVVEINELITEDLDSACGFFDTLFLELHADNTDRPEQIRLRRRNSDEPVAHYAMHFDAVGE